MVKWTLAVGAVGAAAVLGLAGCSGDHPKPKAKASGPESPPPEPKIAGETLKGSGGLRKPVRYSDAITVAIIKINKVRSKGHGPGAMPGRPLTIFTLRFTNGSGQPLDLNKVRVVARYGKGAQASPTSYGNLNDFYGTVAPGKSRSAAYAFALPPSGYKNVTVKVAFDARHKVAVFAGSIST